MLITNLKDAAQRKTFIEWIERKLNRAAKCWELTTDSKISKKARKDHEADYQRLTDEVENELKKIGIKCSWPGLFPTYIINGRQEHNLDWAIKKTLNIK